MRILYLYPEEWTGQRAREIHTLHTAAAMAAAGAEVLLITGGAIDLQEATRKIEVFASPSLTTKYFSRTLSLGSLKIQSHAWFRAQLDAWYQKETRKPFDLGFAIHLKAAQWFQKRHIPYIWEAHEIFSETSPKRFALEQAAVKQAFKRIATSQALAQALKKIYGENIHFEVIPNAGLPPQKKSAHDPQGPLLYAGGLEAWKGLHIALSAALSLNKTIRIVGGNEEQKNSLLAALPFPERHQNIEWSPRQNTKDLFRLFQGASAGIISTPIETPSGLYSCPMKLFDYARAGLPVISSALPSLASLACGSWLKIVKQNDIQAWIEALKDPPQGGEEPLKWAAQHTWENRGKKILDYAR